MSLLFEYSPGSVVKTTAAAIAVLYLLYKIILEPFFLSPLRHLPGPKNGILTLARGAIKRPTGIHFLELMNSIPNEGLIYFRGFLGTSRILLTEPKTLGELLVTNSYDYEKPAAVRDMLRESLGDGLICVEGDYHNFLRKNIMPSFSFRHIKDLYTIFWSKATQLTQSVSQQISESAKAGASADDSAVVEVNHWANLVTLDIIGLAAMGRDLQALKDNNDPLVSNYEELMKPTREKQIYFGLRFFLPKAVMRYIPLLKIAQRRATITHDLHDICLQLVRDKKVEVQQQQQQPEKQEAPSSDPSVPSMKQNRDVLSLLLTSDNFSELQLVDQLLTFLAAGHDTTSSAFTWTTYLLSLHQSTQAALRAEVRNAIPSPLPPNFDLASTLESLPLLNGVCNETLRLYPTVPITIRKAIRPTTLLGYPIPKGTEVLLVPYAINRNPTLWGPDAGEFRPSRWIDTDSATGEQKPNNSGGAPSNYAQLTFLHGPRSCIGSGFAKAELRCLVAAFVAAFDLKMADPDEVVIVHGVVTSKPKNGMRLRLTPIAS